MKNGRRFGRPPDPYQPPATPTGKINVTDPDSQLVKAQRGWIQGYNAQAAVNEQQVVVAAELTTDSPDFGHLEPMVDATRTELENAGVADQPQVVVADAGYWHQQQMENIVASGIEVIVPPDAGKRKGTRPGWDGGAYQFMRRVLATDAGRALLPQTPGHGRARLRPHQVQPADRPLPTPRKSRLPVGMAADRRHPQPPQAPHPSDRPRRRLTGAREPGLGFDHRRGAARSP
jgi:hypothetical protein